MARDRDCHGAGGPMTSLDFAVIGAAKAGTTTLFEHLRNHPQLFIPARKELTYFYEPEGALDGYYRDAAEYHAHFFTGLAAGQLAGIATPQYMYGAPADGPLDRSEDEAAREIPRRLQAYAPDLKLIAILRDPVARALSHYRMNLIRNIDRDPYELVIERLLEPEALERARRAPTVRNLLVAIGEYGRILQGYVDVFGQQRLLVIFTAELQRDPAGVTSEVCRFLGVDDPPSVQTEWANRGATRRRLQRVDLYEFQRALAKQPLLRQAWRALPAASRLGAADRFQSAAYRFADWNRASGPEQPPSAEITARLREHFREDTDRLSALLGAAPAWAPEPLTAA